MTGKKEEFEEKATFEVFFPMTRKKKLGERKVLFEKMKLLIEPDKESLPTKNIAFKKNYVLLEAEEFGVLVSFDKPISIRMMMGKDFEKNKSRVNDLANKLVSHINTILGESAKGAEIYTTLVGPSRTAINVAKKFVEETKLAKINELTKKTLSPEGIMFGYASGGHESMIMHLYDEKATVAFVMSQFKYKDFVPWDFTLEEYKNLKESMDIIGKLAQKEF